MRLGDYRTSDNVRDQGVGGGGGGGGFGGGGGGGLFGMLFGLVLSRFGIGGVLLLLLGYCALSMMGGTGSLTGGGGGSGAVAPHQQGARGSGATSSAAEACAADPARRFTCQVLASTEDTWTQLFQANGQTYQAPGLDFYTRGGSSGCGAAQSAMGPFYCPTDNKIYLDVTFFSELQNRFGAQGDFAQAYVIAHEVGHHIQNLTGVLERARREQQGVSSREGNAVQVRVELQADCYAGVYAANARDRQGQAVMEPGDLEEGLRAAQAIGDDTLQQQSQGRVVPESFTHGTAAQRSAWLRRGYESRDPAQCDTFTGQI